MPEKIKAVAIDRFQSLRNQIAMEEGGVKDELRVQLDKLTAQREALSDWSRQHLTEAATLEVTTSLAPDLSLQEVLTALAEGRRTPTKDWLRGIN